MGTAAVVVDEEERARIEAAAGFSATGADERCRVPRLGSDVDTAAVVEPAAAVVTAAAAEADPDLLEEAMTATSPAIPRPRLVAAAGASAAAAARSSAGAVLEGAGGGRLAADSVVAADASDDLRVARPIGAGAGPATLAGATADAAEGAGDAR